jgi:hypothetical protein
MPITQAERTAQEQAGNLVNKEVLQNQNSLIDHLMEKEIFSYEDVGNLYKTDNELLDEGFKAEEIENGDADNMKEIYEWWLVSDWLLDKLEAEGEPVLRTDYGDWWGRTCTGQAIALDSVIQKIAKEFKF